MFRIAFIAYFSFATVFGPLLCCCNMQRLLGSPINRSCCQRQFECHKSQHCKACERNRSKSQSEEASQATKNSSHRHDHPGGKCPCGRRQATMLASSGSSQSLSNSTIDIPTLQWPIPIASLPEQAAVVASITSMFAKFRPADLYGREILRAYQILRC
jgi:hypothetical protein